jgi:hypothetical protein
VVNDNICLSLIVFTRQIQLIKMTLIGIFVNIVAKLYTLTISEMVNELKNIKKLNIVDTECLFELTHLKQPTRY